MKRLGTELRCTTPPRPCESPLRADAGSSIPNPGKGKLLQHVLAHKHMSELTIDCFVDLEQIDKEGWDLLHDALPADFAVERLNLSELVVDDLDTMRSMFRALGRMPHLKSLDLLNVYGMQGDAETPDQRLELDSVCVTFTRQSDDKKHRIDSFLVAILHISQPASVNISVCTNSIKMIDQEHRAIATALGCQRGLEVLALQFKRIGSGSALKHYVDFLASNGTLKAFSLDLEVGNSIGSTRLNRLIAALKVHSRLNDLSLLGCQQGKGSNHIALEQLMDLPELRCLRLGRNRFDWEDVEPLFKALGKNTKLQWLDLGGTSLQFGLQYTALGAALEENQTLEYLRLGTPRCTGYVEPLAEAMQKNTSLLGIDFVDADGRIEQPTDGIMLTIKKRGEENRLRAWKIALAHGGMQMLLHANPTLASRSGAITFDHAGSDAAKLGLVNKQAQEHARAFMLCV